MPYSQVKVYSDGSHYIGIPYEPNPRAKNRCPRYEEVIEVKEPVADAEVNADDEPSVAVETEQTAQNLDGVHEKSAPPAVRQMTRKELFDELYQQTFGMKKREQKSYIVKQMLPYFEDGSSCRAFVEQNFERKHRNMICRRTRLWRKINHQRFNYFVTFTYADDKMTEEEFAKKLLNTLYHFSSRKGWLYIAHGNAAGKPTGFTFTVCSISLKALFRAKWRYCTTSIPAKGECRQYNRIRFLPRSSGATRSDRLTISPKCRKPYSIS